MNVTFENSPTSAKATLVLVDGKPVGQIKSQGRNMLYCVTIVLPEYTERDNVFSYKGAKQAAIDILADLAS